MSSCSAVRVTPPRRQENQASSGTRTRRFTHQGWATSPMVMGGFYRESRGKSSRRRTATKIPTRKETVRLRRRTLQLQECGSGAHARADDDFEGHVQFLAVPEFFQGDENFGFGLNQFFWSELFDQRAEGRGDFGELLPVFFDG